MRGRKKSPAVDLQQCIGIVSEPGNADEWMRNAIIVRELIAHGATAKAIADAVGVSQSTVGRWHKIAARWTQDIKDIVHRAPERFPSETLTALTTDLWPDIDPHIGKRTDKRQTGKRHRTTLLATVQMIAQGGSPPKSRAAVAEYADKMRALAQKERSRSIKLEEEIKRLLEEKEQLARQVGSSDIDALRRENALLKQALVKARSGAVDANKTDKAKGKSADILKLEEVLRAGWQVRVEIDYPNGILVMNGGKPQVLDGVIDKLMGK